MPLTAFETLVAALLPSPGAGQSLKAWNLQDISGADQNAYLPWLGTTDVLYAINSSGGSDPAIIAELTQSFDNDVLDRQDGSLDGDSVFETAAASFCFVMVIGQGSGNYTSTLLPRDAIFFFNGNLNKDGWSIRSTDGFARTFQVAYEGVASNIFGSAVGQTNPNGAPTLICFDVSSTGTARLRYINQCDTSGAVVTVGTTSAFTMLAPGSHNSGKGNYQFNYNNDSSNWDFSETFWMGGNGAPSNAQLLAMYQAALIELTLASSTPAAGATGVSTSSQIDLSFNLPTRYTTIALFLQDSGGNSVPVVPVNYQFTGGSFAPATGLKQSTLYTATIAAAAGIGLNPLAAPISFSFTTGTATAPTVASYSPANSAAYVSVSTPISIVFNQAIYPGTINFALAGPSGAIACAVSYNAVNFTATIRPTGNLPALATITATLNGVANASGQTLASAVSWSFSTTTAPAAAAPANIYSYSKSAGWRVWPKRIPASASANCLGLWNFLNYAANASADLSAHGYSCTFTSGTAAVANSYFPALFDAAQGYPPAGAPQLNGTTQSGSIANFMNGAFPSQWTLTVGFVLNAAPAANARILQKQFASGDLIDIFFATASTITMKVIAGGTTYSFTTPVYSATTTVGGANQIPAALDDGKQHTASIAFGGSTFTYRLDAIPLQNGPGANPNATSSGSLTLGADTAGANHAPITLQFLEFEPRCLTQAECVQRHQSWAGPQNDSFSRLQLVNAINPENYDTVQEGTATWNPNTSLYEMFFTAGVVDDGRCVKITSATPDFASYTDCGVVLGNGIGGEIEARENCLFVDPASGERYLYYRNCGTGQYTSQYCVAVEQSDGTFKRYGGAFFPAGGATTIYDVGIVLCGSIYYGFTEGFVNGSVPTQMCFLYTASDPKGPWTIQNGGNPLRTIGGTQRPTLLQQAIGGLWHMWQDSKDHFVNDNLTTDTWQKFGDGSEFFDGFYSDGASHADYSMQFCNGNMIFTFTRNGPGADAAQILVFNALNASPQQLVTPDNIPGGIGTPRKAQ
jgi:hypothetical protein